MPSHTEASSILHLSTIPSRTHQPSFTQKLFLCLLHVGPESSPENREKSLRSLYWESGSKQSHLSFWHTLRCHGEAGGTGRETGLGRTQSLEEPSIYVAHLKSWSRKAPDYMLGLRKLFSVSQEKDANSSLQKPPWKGLAEPATKHRAFAG